MRLGYAKRMKPILYIKAGCPWCNEALEFFKVHGVELDVRDVMRDAAAFERMGALTGQTKCPTLEWEDFVVADFSVAELRQALDKAPGVRGRLFPGLG